MSKNRFTLALLCTIALTATLSACRDDNDATETRYEIASSDFPLVDTDGQSWVYITDTDGNVLDVQKPRPGIGLALKSPKPVEKFNLTTVLQRVDPATGKTTVEVNTYGGLDAGVNWKQVELGVSQPIVDQTDLLYEVDNFDLKDNGLWFSSPNVDIFRTGGSVTGNVLLANILMYSKPTDMLLTTYRAGIPVYAQSKPATSGQMITLDLLNDFSPMLHLHKMEYEGSLANNAVIGGGKLRDNTLTKSYQTILDTNGLYGTSYQSTTPTIGYVDGFDVYSIRASANYTGGVSSYTATGITDMEKALNELSLPDFSLTVSNNSIAHYSYNFSQEFTYYTTFSYFVEGNVTYIWNTNAPKGFDLKIGNIPNEIAAQIPALAPDKFNVALATFTHTIKGASYKDAALHLVTEPVTIQRRYYY